MFKTMNSIAYKVHFLNYVIFLFFSTIDIYTIEMILGINSNNKSLNITQFNRTLIKIKFQ